MSTQDFLYRWSYQASLFDQWNKQEFKSKNLSVISNKIQIEKAYEMYQGTLFFNVKLWSSFRN